MMTDSACEAKTRLSELIARVQRYNKEVVSRRHGRATDRLVPITHDNRSAVHKALRVIVIKGDPAADTESDWEHV